MASSDPTEDMRIVLLGKTGAGKSSTGNTLLGRKVFKEVTGIGSGTKKCEWAMAVVHNVIQEVTDTPGLCDTDMSQEEVLKEVGKSIAVATPGPHIILMVIKLDRYTPDDFNIYCTLKEMFGPDVVRYMIILFVRLDEFGDTLVEQRKQLEEQLTHNAPDTLRQVLHDADNRYFGINNKANKKERWQQASELIAMMKELKRQRGATYFINDLSNKVADFVKPMVDSRIRKDGKSPNEATREINKAIVNETVPVNFFEQLMDVMTRNVLPIILKGLGIAAQSLATKAVSAATNKLDKELDKKCTLL